MSDLIIKPSGTSANFKVQNPSGTDKIVMNSSGTITTATLGSGVTGGTGLGFVKVKMGNYQFDQGMASGTQTITGVGFQPDWVWIKNRDQTDGHHIYDSVRGVTKRIRPDT